MSENKMDPKPGQVWGWADLQPGEHLLVRPDYGKRPGEWVVRVNGRSTNDCCAFYGCETPEDQRGIAKRFIRWATPAECRAAGLDPDAVLPPAAEPSAATPKPERPEFIMSMKMGRVYRVVGWAPSGRPICRDNECDYSFEIAHDNWQPHTAAQAPQNMAQAAIDAYEARIKALERERDYALANLALARETSERVQSEARYAATVSADYAARLRALRDAALRDAAEQRQRAERAEAECAAMRANDMFRRTPAPTQGGPAPQLTPEDRAWMDARQDWDADLAGELRARAKAAIAARAKGV